MKSAVKIPASLLKLGNYIKQNWHGLTVSLLLGGALATCTLLVLQNYNPPDDAPPQASIVFGQIVKQNEMVTASQHYMLTEKNEDTNKIGSFSLPFTENHFWYRYVGMIKAGVNLETARFDMPSEYVIVVTLDAPYIISNDPDMERSGVLEEKNNLLLNPIHVEDVDAFQKILEERSVQYAYEFGILEEARTNAETNIRAMFLGALGEEYTVEFIWNDVDVPGSQAGETSNEAAASDQAAE